MATLSNRSETAPTKAIKSLTTVVVHEADKGGVYQASKRLKSLQVTRSKLLSTRKQSRDAISNHEGNIKDADRRLIEVEAEINAIQDSGTVVVSEHAILRYLERFGDVNLDEIAERVKELPEHCFVRRGSTIVTIIDGPRHLTIGDLRPDLYADDPVTDLLVKHPDTTIKVNDKAQS